MFLHHNRSLLFHLFPIILSYHTKVAFLPEGFDFIGDTKDAARELAEPVGGPTVDTYRGAIQ